MEKIRLNSNNLKVIGAICMVVDHFAVIFVELLPLSVYCFCRIVGRLAFPIFAYLIAEGCRYTRHKDRYFLTVLLVGLICMLGYILFTGGLYFNVLITFSFSILLIYLYQQSECAFVDKRLLKEIIFYLLIFAFLVAIYLFQSLSNTYLVLFFEGCEFDYGLLGVILPLLAYIFKNKWLKISVFAVGLVALSLESLFSFFLLGDYTFEAYIQFFSLLVIPLICLYSGERGRLKMKCFFYIFYPLQFVLLYGLYMLVVLII